MLPMVRFELNDGRQMIAGCEFGQETLSRHIRSGAELLMVAENCTERVEAAQIARCETWQAAQPLPSKIAVYHFAAVTLRPAA